jgi:hypothetical protein
VEAKAVEKILPIHKAQLLSYMKLLDVPLGLLINFHEMKVTDGISRLLLFKSGPTTETRPETHCRYRRPDCQPVVRPVSLRFLRPGQLHRVRGLR